jgi:hypothetical protein
MHTHSLLLWRTIGGVIGVTALIGLAFTIGRLASYFDLVR